MKVAFEVNGRPREVDGHPMARLLDVLRVDLALTGTKEGCGEGECGACTVLMDGEPVLSCLVPLVQCAERRVDTVEAIAEGPARPFVERFVASGGVQCGACTPGIIVTSWALLQSQPSPTRAEAAEALAGNLCRCTGYEGIFDALVAGGGAASEEARPQAAGDAQAGLAFGESEPAPGADAPGSVRPAPEAAMEGAGRVESDEDPG